jgi:hypothetical protein
MFLPIFSESDPSNLLAEVRGSRVISSFRAFGA